MLNLTYDSESTGLVLFRMPSDHPEQPRVISLAAELHDDDTGRPFGAMNLLIKPDGWTVPAEVTELTGITTEMCEKYGVPIHEALSCFIGLWDCADQRIGHNEAFDMRMIRIELMRNDYFSRESMATEGGVIPFADHWKAGAAFCTQGKSTKLVNGARPDGEKKKTATLAEAYKFFTGMDLVNAHSAQADMLACKAVYYGLKDFAEV